MNIALVGSGSIAREHARAIRALRSTPAWRDLCLLRVMGRTVESASAFAAEFSISRATTELDQILADPDVDAVVVCSPTDLHASQTEQALRAGKHVLSEVPLATSLADADKLIALSTEVDRRLMVCHTHHYYAPLIEARRMVADGELHPHAIVGRSMFLRRNTVNWKGKRRTWTDNLIWHHGCHAVAAVLWILGATDVDVQAQVALPGEDLGIPMDFTVVMRTPRDQIATVVMSYNSHITLRDLLIIGEETSVLIADKQLRSGEHLLAEEADGPLLESPIARQDTEFFAAVRDGREPAISGQAIRPAMAALQHVQDAFDARLQALGAETRHPRFP